MGLAKGLLGLKRRNETSEASIYVPWRPFTYKETGLYPRKAGSECSRALITRHFYASFRAEKSSQIKAPMTRK